MTTTNWTEPKYPGDAVRLAMLQRRGELGDVRIMHYEINKYRVAMFLPGIDIDLPGDTPKTAPERDQWCSTRPEANAYFAAYLAKATRDGWVPYAPR